MENNIVLESVFKIKELILLESSFSRIHNIDFDKIQNEPSKVKVDVEVSVNENIITVIEEVTIAQKYKEIEQFSVRVKMVAIFECVGDSPIPDFNEFGRINGAAIIFPYIREHITSITFKAGMGTITLPIMNFSIPLSKK
jgi:preprotein translocase subunit SecB